MKCKYCGQELAGDELFCGNCGTRIDRAESETLARDYPKTAKQKNYTMIAVIIASVAVLFAACAGIGYIFIHDNKNNDEQILAAAVSTSPAATQSPQVSPTPTIPPTPNVVYVTPEPTPQIIYVTQEPGKEPPTRRNYSVVRTPIYDTYYDSDFNFSCQYPEHFNMYIDSNHENRYTVSAPDGTAVQKIYARSNADGSLTVDSALADFKRSVGGRVDYETSGSDYFAVRMKNGERYYYKYCKFKNGRVVGFEFDFDVDLFDVYDGYINDIYNSLKIN